MLFMREKKKNVTILRKKRLRYYKEFVDSHSCTNAIAESI